MRRYEQKLLLTVGTDQSRPLTQAQLDLLAQSLNQRFKDAEFQIKALEEANPLEKKSPKFNHKSFDISLLPKEQMIWHPTQLTFSAREIYDLLVDKKDWQRLDGCVSKGVKIRRLRQQLPDYLRIVSKHGFGYKIVDLRREP
jgi:hypothetical protein